MNRYRLAIAGSFIASLLVLEGCGKEPPPPIAPAHGIVLINGAPLPNAQVRFIPQIDHGPEFIASGVTDEEGRFTLQCNGQPGACATENIVIISEADLPSELMGEDKQRELAAYRRALKNRPIPQLYATPVNTPLRVNVTEEQAEHQLELKR